MDQTLAKPCVFVNVDNHLDRKSNAWRSLIVAMEEVEVEAVQVLHKRLKLRTVQGSIFPAWVDVYECESPYVLIFKVSTDHEHALRMDVHKDDLAAELRQWLEGKAVRNAAVFPPKRIDEVMSKFVKFGKAPLQEDLLVWILSRSELQWAPEAVLSFGGLQALSASPSDLGPTTGTNGHAELDMSHTRENPFGKTAEAAAKSSAHADEAYRIANAYSDQDDLDAAMAVRPHLLGGGSDPAQAGNNRAAFSHSVSLKKAHMRSTDPSPHAMTRQLIGQSAALSRLKVHNVRGREGAREVVAVTDFTPYHWKLASEIEGARHEVAAAMDLRRRQIEIGRSRKQSAEARYGAIRQTLGKAKSGGGWLKSAEQELLNLRKVKADIEDDVLRQKTRAHREAQKVRWTIAPSGFADLRGKSQRGVVLGPGPIPSSAMGASKDPVVERTMKQYFWDSAGRRHVRKEDADGDAAGSAVERAMEAIRKAATSTRTHELDLRGVFSDFDSSGNGSLSLEEMAAAFEALGVELDVASLMALFHHFDPNGVGEVTIGEFVWAFFNRRGLVRQWRRKTDKLTEAQIRAKFYAADSSGNGKLDGREFARFLKSFGIDTTPAEQQALMDRFDSDGNGSLDLDEFRSFLASELMQLNAESTGVASELDAGSPHGNGSPLAGAGARAVAGSGAGAGPGGKARPASAGPARPPRSLDISLDDDAGGRSGTGGGTGLLGKVRGRPATAAAAGRPSRSLLSDYQPSGQGDERKSGGLDDVDVDPTFVAKSLQTQHAIERKLGHQYY